MATSSVTRQAVGATTHRQRVRESRPQRPVDTDAAYDVCERITRARASNLYHAIETLPAYRRRALCAIYAFARRVHDAAGGGLHRTQKLWLLAQARGGIPHDGTPRPVDPVLVALRDVKRRFPIPLASLEELIDGVDSDVHGVTYETFEDLVRYCRQVAGSIGRVSVAILGSLDPAAAGELADDLGVAVQLTNILRDVVEDFERGRVYLPRETFELLGCPASPLSAPPELASRVIRHEARRNREWYEHGLLLLPLLDSRGAACVTAMVGIYQGILDRIEYPPNDTPRLADLAVGYREGAHRRADLTTGEGRHVPRIRSHPTVRPVLDDAERLVTSWRG
jgi:phytoene synthase